MIKASQIVKGFPNLFYKNIKGFHTFNKKAIINYKTMWNKYLSQYNFSDNKNS